MNMHAMVRALQDYLGNPEMLSLGFEKKLGFVVDAEWSARHQKSLDRRMKHARLRHQGCIEKINYHNDRNINKELIEELSACRWISKHHNILISGPTGIGKTFLLCVFAQKACREGYNVVYHRISRFLELLRIARAG